MNLPTWDATARDFTYYLRAKGKAEVTAFTYTENLSKFWRWSLAHETDPRTADRPAVRHWLNERLDAVSARRAHNELASLRQWFAFCREERWRDDDPCVGLSVKRAKILPTKPITPEELDQLVAAATNERDRLIVLFMAYTAVRISEMAGLRAEDCDWKRGTVRIFGKGSKERELAPNPEIMGRLHAFIGMFPAGPVWLSQVQRRALSAQQIRKIIYGLGQKAGIPDLHPHRLRAFFGTEHINQFGDIHALQAIMGHENINTTAGYAHWSQQRRAQEQQRRFAAGRHEATG